MSWAGDATLIKPKAVMHQSSVSTATASPHWPRLSLQPWYVTARSGRFSVVKSAEHRKEQAKYAVKVVENKSLADEENLEALETEVRAGSRLNRRKRLARISALPHCLCIHSNTACICSCICRLRSCDSWTTRTSSASKKSSSA